MDEFTECLFKTLILAQIDVIKIPASKVMEDYVYSLNLFKVLSLLRKWIVLGHYMKGLSFHFVHLKLT